MPEAKGSHVKKKEEKESISETEFRAILREYDKSEGDQKAYNRLSRKAEKLGMPRTEFRYATWYLDTKESGKEVSLDPKVMESISSWRRQQLGVSVNRYRLGKR